MHQLNNTAHQRGSTSAVNLQALIWTRGALRPLANPQEPGKQLSRYERMSLSMLGYTWGVLVVAVTALHFGNYDLETKTSSTSGSHSEFHDITGTPKSDAKAPQ